MSLRPCDAEPYLRLKTQIESRPTNSNAVYQDGKFRPVFVYTLDGRDVFVVEGDDYKFYPAQQVPGSVWVRWEAKPDPQPAFVDPPPVESTKLKGSTWAELRTSAEAIERKARTGQQAAHAEQQGISAPDSAFAQASRKHANDVAARLRPSR